MLFSKIGEAMVNYAEATASSYAASAVTGNGTTTGVNSGGGGSGGDGGGGGGGSVGVSGAQASVQQAQAAVQAAVAGNVLGNAGVSSGATPILPQPSSGGDALGAMLGKRKKDDAVAGSGTVVKSSGGKKEGGKRMRFNWTADEEEKFAKVYMEMYEKISEKDLVEKLFEALEGGRTQAQCKGHLKNLQRAGKLPLPGPGAVEAGLAAAGLEEEGKRLRSAKVGTRMSTRAKSDK